MQEKIDIVIADDHGLIRYGLIKLLSEVEDFRVIDEAGNGSDALALVRKWKPKVLIADLFMPELSGIEIAQNIINEGLPTSVLIISASYDEDNVISAYQNGALGYIFKGSNEALIISAVRKVAQHETFYSQLVMNILGNQHQKKSSQSITTAYQLTRRELQILKLLAEGVTNKEIAYDLNLSTRTVDAHRRNIMEKLSVSNTAQLIRVSIEKNLI
ncbi:LuxR C-terminal-related transcriptional regulator [Marinoscillum pacificum]|uniref:LuxR C-terminal-related transcriptional regulator n=1 Tax=Marinoscillum pacificum TaxID=392723 RepID=UPI0021585AE6|nr:response regulator transcription factor [Marinoscillum pacificum]